MRISITLDKKRTARRILFALAWLLLWQLLSLAVDNKILLVGPYETLLTLFSEIGKKTFILSLGGTFLRIAGGFFTGLFIGALLALCSYRSEVFCDFISPLVSVVKSIPVASFVILILIWAGAPMLSLVISCLVVFPIFYLNIYEGLKAAPHDLLEMAHVFGMKRSYVFKHIRVTSLKPFLQSSISLACGMAWKSGIAAEVIGRPAGSLGGNIYLSKVYLETSELFAWTLVAVLAAALFEKVIKYAAGRCLK